MLSDVVTYAGDKSTTRYDSVFRTDLWFSGFFLLPACENSTNMANRLIEQIEERHDIILKDFQKAVYLKILYGEDVFVFLHWFWKDLLLRVSFGAVFVEKLWKGWPTCSEGQITSQNNVRDFCDFKITRLFSVILVIICAFSDFCSNFFCDLLNFP